MPLIEKIAEKDNDDNIEGMPKKQEEFDREMESFEFKSETGSGIFQGKNCPKSDSWIGQNNKNNKKFELKTGEAKLDVTIDKRNNQEDYEKVEKFNIFKRNIVAKNPEKEFNSPVRNAIRKGIVAAIRKKFDHEAVEEDDEAKNTLKRLRRPCLKPLKPASGKKKKKLVSNFSSRKSRNTSSNQSSILDYYPRNEGEEKGPGDT